MNKAILIAIISVCIGLLIGVMLTIGITQTANKADKAPRVVSNNIRQLPLKDFYSMRPGYEDALDKFNWEDEWKNEVVMVRGVFVGISYTEKDPYYSEITLQDGSGVLTIYCLKNETIKLEEQIKNGIYYKGDWIEIKVKRLVPWDGSYQDFLHMYGNGSPSYAISELINVNDVKVIKKALDMGVKDAEKIVFVRYPQEPKLIKINTILQNPARHDRNTVAVKGQITDVGTQTDQQVGWYDLTDDTNTIRVITTPGDIPKRGDDLWVSGMFLSNETVISQKERIKIKK